MKILLLGSVNLFVFLTLLYATPILGTPLIAIRETENCGACHKPGRSQLPFMWRRCTLDCQGCHIDPNGSGARNQWGYYYSKDQLNMVEFFSPIDPLKDTSRFDLHYDGRVISRSEAGEVDTTPMASEFTLRLRPLIRWLHFTYSALFLGRTDDSTFRFGPNKRFFREKYNLMIDSLPMNLYLKYGRSQPVYGQRRSNHSLWIRERVGLDQFSLTDALTVGGTLNVPFIHYSAMEGDPYQPSEDRQKGYSIHSGLRGVSYGWNIHGSLWDTASEKTQVKMSAIGGGAHIADILLMAERNFRDVKNISLSTSEISNFDKPGRFSHPSSTISEYTVAWTGIKGFMAGMIDEKMDTDSFSSFRRSFFVDVHPFPSVQLEVWRRQETGARNLWDTLTVFHLYEDF